MRIIDADALMERLKAWDTNDAIDKALYNFALNRVLEAPTIEPERKTGRWLIRRDTNGKPYAQCSECKRYFNNVYDMENFDAFCRHCGTKMEGLKEVEK